MSWTRAHSRLVDAWCDLYRIHACRGHGLRTLESWLGAKFGNEGPWANPRHAPPRRGPPGAPLPEGVGLVRRLRRTHSGEAAMTLLQAAAVLQRMRDNLSGRSGHARAHLWMLSSEVEQRAFNPRVLGSTPRASSTFNGS